MGDGIITESEFAAILASVDNDPNHRLTESSSTLVSVDNEAAVSSTTRFVENPLQENQVEMEPAVTVSNPMDGVDAEAPEGGQGIGRSTAEKMTPKPQTPVALSHRTVLKQQPVFIKPKKGAQKSGKLKRGQTFAVHRIKESSDGGGCWLQIVAEGDQKSAGGWIRDRKGWISDADT